MKSTPPSSSTSDIWCLRGLARHSGHWGNFLDSLSAHFPESRIFTHDFAGTGARHRESAHTSVKEMADDLCRTLDDKRPKIIIALSLGAMVTLEIAARSPTGLTGCVLINPSSSDVARPWERMQPRALLRLSAASLSPLHHLQERIILSTTSNLDDAPLQHLHAWSHLAKKFPMQRRNLLRQVRAAASFHAPKSVSPRLLWLVSEHDRIVSPACAKRLHLRLGGELQTHPTSGHDLTLDAPDWCIEQIANWLAPKQ